MRNVEDIVKIKFLMNMFSGMALNRNGEVIPGGVAQFKSVLHNMAQMSQITDEIEDIMLQIYGISNTDTFRPSVQGSKIQGINSGMAFVEQKTARACEDEDIKIGLNMLVESKLISQLVYDILLRIYFGVDSRAEQVTKQNQASKQSTPQKLQANKASNRRDTTKAPHIKSDTFEIRLSGVLAEKVKNSGLNTIRKLRGLSTDEIKQIMRFYEQVKKTYCSGQKHLKLCPYFTEIAYIQYKDDNRDPCSRGPSYRTIHVSKIDMNKIQPESLVYMVDRDDSCQSPIYVPIGAYIDICLERLVYEYKHRKS